MVKREPERKMQLPAPEDIANRLGNILKTFGAMAENERRATFAYLRRLYPNDWPYGND